MTPKQALKRLRAIERLQRSIRSRYLHSLPPPRGTPLQMALSKKMAVDLIEYYQLEYNQIFSILKPLYDDQDYVIFQLPERKP
jgi:hypothetical protein